MRYVYALFGVLLFALVSVGGDEEYARGDDGYWYRDGVPHTRVLVEQSPYWYCGRYYAGTSYYRYTRHSKPAPTPKDPDWRSKLLDIAAQRDKFEADARKGAAEQQYFLEGVRALGLEGNFAWRSPRLYSSLDVTYGANASTQYGYSYSTLAQVYGDNNLPQLYQQAAQLAQGAQRLSGEASSKFSDLVGQEGLNRARVAEVLARGQVLTAISQSLAAGPEVRGIRFTVSSGGKMQRVEEDVDPDIKRDLSKQFSALAAARCAGCHSGDKVRGNFDVGSYPQLSPEQKQLVWARLVDPDDKRVMPQAGPGEQLKRLTPAELRLFFLN